MIDSASEFMKRTGAFVGGFLYPKTPELTLDIINEARKDFEVKDKELHELIKWLEKYVDGSIYGYFYAQSMTEITEELINGLKKKYRIWLREYNLSHKG